MPLFWLYPDNDRPGFIGTGWSAVPNTPWSIYDKIDETGDLIGDYAEHDTTMNGSRLEMAFQDITPYVNSLAWLGEIRIKGIRLVVVASIPDLTGTAKFKAALGTYDTWTSGNPSTTIDTTTVSIPGNKILSWTPGPDFMEVINVYRSEWSTRDQSGNLWNWTNLDQASVVILGWGHIRIYRLFMEVELDIQPSALLGKPFFPNQHIGWVEPYTWQFHNKNTGSAQKKYRIKIYTPDQYSGITAAGGPDIAPSLLDSGEVRSSNNFHDFTTRKGAKLTPAITTWGTYYMSVKVAKDFQGQDWWSAWTDLPFYLESPGSHAFVYPTPNEVITASSRPTVSWSYSAGAGNQKAVRVRIYQQPAAGWTGFDPDTTEEEPKWDYLVDGQYQNVQSTVSLRPGTYRAYISVLSLKFDEWTDWAYQDFTMAAPGPVALAKFNVTQQPANARVNFDLQWATGSSDYATEGLEIVRKVPGYDDQFVRIPTPDIHNGLLANGVRLGNDTFNTITATNATGYQVTNLDTEVGVRFSNWASPAQIALASRWKTLGGDFRSWKFLIRADRKLELHWSTTGINDLVATSSVALPTITNGTYVRLRVQLTTTNPYNVKFWYSTNDGATWVQLGSTITGGAATSIFNTTTNGNVELGSSDQGLGDYGPIDIRYWRLRTDIAGADKVVVDARGAGALIVTGAPTSWAISGNKTSFVYDINFNDEEMPLNETVTYEARVIGLHYTGTEYRYGTVSTTTATLDLDTVWLKCVNDTAKNTRFYANESWLSRKTYKASAIHRPLGRSLPVAVKGDGKGDSFEFKFLVVGHSQFLRMIDLLNCRDTLYLQTPKRSWFVEVGADFQIDDHLFDYMRNEDDVTIIAVPFVEVKSPDVPSIS